MAMTPKQEKFAQAIADGMTQADAYRHAYDAGGMKDSSIHVNASKLLSDTKVAQRVKELKTKVAEKALWTREKSVLALAEIAEGIDARANEKVAAIKELNAMHGFNEPVKVEIGGEIVTRVVIADLDDDSND